MDAQDFTTRLSTMSSDDFSVVGARLGTQLGTAAGEIEWWETTLVIQRSLRAHSASRAAARAAHQATAVVQAAAQRVGFELPDESVTRLARAAADVARGLVAGADAYAATANLLRAWAPLLDGAATAAA